MAKIHQDKNCLMLQFLESNAIDTPNITSNKTRFIWRKGGNIAPQSA